MKKKYLLQEWENTQRKFYEYLDRDELERDYMEWFADKEKPKELTDDAIIEALIESELDYRKDDNADELIETIEHIKSLSII
tara:strand:- start:847 stop:1092 length:246 start_codon:yes stop_codon:yes gene_type:complete